MKIEHKLEPLMQIKERKDNIQVYGCYQVGFNFMLKPDIEVPLAVIQELVIKMMKASCDTIEDYNNPSTRITPEELAAELNAREAEVDHDNHFSLTKDIAEYLTQNFELKRKLPDAIPHPTHQVRRLRSHPA